MIWLSVICLVCALLPCVLFFRNVREYPTPLVPIDPASLPPVSVLIPARNEGANIAAALRSVLANHGTEFEVIVLDDHSTDGTAEIVQRFARADSRVRLESAPPLPPGWCGKQHACAALAKCARHPLLMFMDADVRLEPSALVRMTGFVMERDIALASGVPRQITKTFWEKLLIPLIHFVLLGFLPFRRMRASANPAYAAGCGQLFVARAKEYRACGGHAAIRASLHDGIQLPRIFRQHGFRTDLCDATTVASCRMYASGREVFAGLAKNATEGLGAPGRIVPATFLLGAGQVAPFVFLCAPESNWLFRGIAALACLCAVLPRMFARTIFEHPLSSALLHPFGVLALLCIQWIALLRQIIGLRPRWRGRACERSATAAIFVLGAVLLSAADVEFRIRNFELRDQHERMHSFHFPRTNCAVVVVADQKGSEQLGSWIRPVYERFGGTVAIAGVADLSAVPPGLRGWVRRAFVKELDYPVMLDWHGEVVRQFTPTRNKANIYVLTPGGAVVHHWSGEADSNKLAELKLELSKLHLRR